MAVAGREMGGGKNGGNSAARMNLPGKPVRGDPGRKEGGGGLERKVEHIATGRIRLEISQ